MNSKILFNFFVSRLVAAGADARVAKAIVTAYNVTKPALHLTDAEFAEMNRGLDALVGQYKQRKTTTK